MAVVLYAFIGWMGYIVWRCVQLWKVATKDRKEEKLKLCVFAGRWFWRTCICIPRALMPIFKVFEGKCCGLTFEGVHIWVYDSKGNICVGTRVKDTVWKHDIGSAGMVSSEENDECAAKKELYEEVGLEGKLERIGILLPTDGVSCIIHMYKVCLAEECPVLCSTDGSYKKIEWCSSDVDLLKEKFSVKKDMSCMWHLL